jgi:hypothetical protein
MRTVRQLVLSYGVVAHYIPQDLTCHQFLQTALTRLIIEGHFSEESQITILAGHFGSECGASYFIAASIYMQGEGGKLIVQERFWQIQIYSAT